MCLVRDGNNYYYLWSTGFQFWKVGSRNFFAIKEENNKKSRKRIVVSDSESDDDFRKRKRFSSDIQVSQVLSEIKADYLSCDSVLNLFALRLDMSPS